MDNTAVREIHGAKINPKSSLKNQGAQNALERKLRDRIYIYMHTSAQLNTEIRWIGLCVFLKIRSDVVEYGITTASAGIPTANLPAVAIWEFRFQLSYVIFY